MILLYIICFRHFGRHNIQHSCDGSISLSESVLVKVSGVDDDIEKEVLVSWSLQASSSQTVDHLSPLVSIATFIFSFHPLPFLHTSSVSLSIFLVPGCFIEL